MSRKRYSICYTIDFIVRGIRLKDKARKNYFKFQNQYYLNKSIKLRAEVKKMAIQKVQNNMHCDSRKFWSFV